MKFKTTLQLFVAGLIVAPVSGEAQSLTGLLNDTFNSAASNYTQQAQGAFNNAVGSSGGRYTQFITDQLKEAYNWDNLSPKDKNEMVQIMTRGEAADVLKMDQANDLMEQYDGLLGRGNQRSMILHYSYSDPEGKNRYPELTSEKNFADRSLMSVINVGSWDEVNKASMSIYRPFYLQQTDLAEDKFGSDHFLDMLKTFHGVRVSTLSYLDRTVLASAATTQSQIDSKQQTEILRTISRDMARLAHPEHAMIYRDTDAKIEACLALKGNVQAGKNAKGENTSAAAALAAATGNSSTGNSICGPVPKKGGVYQYCVCLAENDNTVSSGTKGAKQGEGKYSLMERVIFGSARSQGAGASGDSQKKVDTYYETAVALYGDYAGEGSKNLIRYGYIAPQLSIVQKIDRVKNGCESYQNLPQENVSCPISGQAITVKKGIYPALLELLRAWRSPERAQMTPDEFKKKIFPLWVEASLGYVLIAEDIEGILRLNGNPTVTGPTWEPTGEGRRWMRGFADASATATFSRFFNGMESILVDHLTANKTLTREEKEEIGTLRRRIGAQLALAVEDARASQQTAAQLLELSAFSGRQEIADIAWNQAAAAASQERLGRTSELVNFTGGFTAANLGQTDRATQFDGAVGSFISTPGAAASAQLQGIVSQTVGRYSTGPITGITTQSAGGAALGAAQGAASQAVTGGLQAIQQRLGITP